MIEKAKQLISCGECTVAAVTENGETLTAAGSSVRPLYALYADHKAELKGAAVADRVIGRAAACILADAGVCEAYGFLMSETGLRLLEDNGIKSGYSELVPFIENKRGDDMCPMEKTVDGVDDIAECVRRIGQFIETTPYNG